MAFIHKHLRLYERENAEAFAHEGNTRLYTEEDLQRLEIHPVAGARPGVNIAGIAIILQIAERMEEMQHQIQDFVQYVQREVLPRQRAVDPAKGALVPLRRSIVAPHHERNTHMQSPMRSSVRKALSLLVLLVLAGTCPAPSRQTPPSTVLAPTRPANIAIFFAKPTFVQGSLGRRSMRASSSYSAAKPRNAGVYFLPERNAQGPLAYLNRFGTTTMSEPKASSYGMRSQWQLDRKKNSTRGNWAKSYMYISDRSIRCSDTSHGRAADGSPTRNRRTDGEEYFRCRCISPRTVGQNGPGIYNYRSSRRTASTPCAIA